MPKSKREIFPIATLQDCSNKIRNFGLWLTKIYSQIFMFATFCKKYVKSKLLLVCNGEQMLIPVMERKTLLYQKKKNGMLERTVILNPVPDHLTLDKN